MLANYDQFEASVISMIKIRSANYVTTTCDISNLILTVYEDISSDVIFYYETESIKLDKNNDTYDIKTFTESSPGNIDKIYVDIHAMIDDNLLDCSHSVLILDGESKIKITDNSFLSSNHDKSIHLKRNIVKDIRGLDMMVYQDIKQAMIEGIMYHIMTSVPSQVDAPLGNVEYQRFFSEKKKLIAKYPQTGRFDTHGVGTNNINRRMT